MESNGKRIRLLDVLRGFAILGTLGTNIWIFANLGDLSYVFTFDSPAWWASFDELVRLVVLFLVNGKFLGLLTILFGAGLELKYRQSLRRGTAWPGLYVWTSLILLAEGFIHFTLVMEYDIVMSYAVTAIIVAFIVKRGDRAIRRTMMIAGGIHVTAIALLFALILYASQAGQTFSVGDMSQVAALYKEGTWLQQVQFRLSDFLALRMEAFFVIPQNIFLFLTGLRLMRAGAFAPDDNGRRIRRKLLRYGLGIGIPLNLLLFVPGGLFDFPIRYLFAPILAIGYLALFAKLIERYESLRLWTYLEKIGKMALSCYMLQNVMSSFIFYGWGLGLGGKAGSIGTVAIWAGICLIQLGFAVLWLRYFQQGPVETARRFVLKLPVGGLGK